jgi:predicted glycogen debranching enzyme
VLTLQKINEGTTISVTTSGQPIENLLTREWLLTNGCGSYSSSTIIGCNTSSYHGLLIGSLNPPVDRVMALTGCLEMLISKGKIFHLSTFEFPNKFSPAGYCCQKGFRQDVGTHFDYELDKHELTKSVYLPRNTNTLAMVYEFKNVHEPLEFIIRPFVGLRDYHTVQKSFARLCLKQLNKGLLVYHDDLNSCRLFLSCPASKFIKDPQWWFNFVYRDNKERGQNDTEDLWAPGFFKCRINSPVKIVLWANLHLSTADFEPEKLIHTNIEAVREDLQKYQDQIKSIQEKPESGFHLSLGNYRSGNQKLLERFCVAADQFITKRRIADTYKSTILAGYPWFADWGRDAFISLPGLLLSTGRLEEAYSVLTAFAAAADKGMIPSRFEDVGNKACFNSVDASLWFINAAFQYLQASDDSKGFARELLPTVKWIIDSYRNGTRYDIHADSDGLIMAGNEETQLTWMDAKYDGIAFTPRFGKAVEVNALWYNCHCLLAKYYSGQNSANAKQYDALAQKIQKSFCRLFWNRTKAYLNDCILPDGSTDDSLRPNQIFAVSLEHSPLSLEQQKSVVATVQKHLLTPYGLRTLNPESAQYQAVYTGPQSRRDAAYHQGTVWPYLIGPFVESFLKVNQFNPESKKKAAEFIGPLLRHLNEQACLGSVSEIFDAEPPHHPKGCFAQAWSVAELIRAYLLINS